MTPIRILVAAPQGSLLASYADRLAGQGLDVAVAHNGLECLDGLRADPPDALLVEAALPWGGGEGVLARLREDPDLPAVPVALLLSWQERRVPAGPAAREAGDFWDRPLSPALLALKLRRLVRRKRHLHPFTSPEVQP